MAGPSWIDRCRRRSRPDPEQWNETPACAGASMADIPRLLLLDEPYSGLDSEGLILVAEMASDTTRRGGSVIIATHEWERGMKVADAVLALAAGRPVEVGPAAQLTAADLAAAAGGKRGTGSSPPPRSGAKSCWWDGGGAR